MELQDVEFTLLGFGLALVQYFLTMPISPLWNGHLYSALLYLDA